MRKREIDAKLDEIIAFSGIGKYIDTPVKRYSSGMTVRLAFSVAAHLEPEILVIDEVLAVGDAEFQAKCLGKMDDVAKRGRTVLFVSHNMSAVKQLCTKCCVVNNGKISFSGNTDKAVANYLAIHTDNIFYENSIEDSIATVAKVSIITSDQGNLHIVGKPLKISIELICHKKLNDPAISFQVINSQGIAVLYFLNLHKENSFCDEPGRYQLVCELPETNLYPDIYVLKVNFNMGIDAGSIKPIKNICRFEVIQKGSKESYRGHNSAIYFEKHNWKIEKLEE
jgi:ABC-type sulfate/molybdate transport systems ATPase subunit